MVKTQETKSTDLNELIQPQIELKRRLIDFAMDAEDEVAIALEAFSAQQLSRWAKPSLSGVDRTELAIDMFATEGKVTYEKEGVVSQKTVIEAFTEAQSSLSKDEKSWLARWEASFNGLFVVSEAIDRSYQLTNWLTQKQYSVRSNREQASEVLNRLGDGEMMIARLMPVSEDEWTFSGPLTLLGKLGKPKLAVAIGNFRQWFPGQLYGDAPELKEAAWESVKQQYADFVDLFGGEKVVVSGYELNKKLQAYQDRSTEQKLADAGLDSSKSIKDLAQDAGVSKAGMTEAVDALGTEGKVAANLLESQKTLKMVMPKVDLPEDLRRAERVTAFAHPRWGQTFLKDYVRLEELLAADDEPEAIDRLVLKHLENERAIAPVWQQLAQDYGQPLEAALRRILGNDAFEIETDLEGAIARYGKALTPTLPDTASVPVHLHNLFQEALKAVGKDAKKQSGKKKPKRKSGFGS
ncbi:MAG: hypothetical protein WBA01_04705 [Phormidesmis sp.]